MNATLGVELPFTNANTQTTIPLGYIDPPTEIIDAVALGDPGRDAERRHADLEDHPQRRRHPRHPLPPVQRAGDQPGRLGRRHQAARSQRAGLEGHRADEPAGGLHRRAAADGARRCRSRCRQRPAARPDQAARHHHAVHRRRSDDRQPDHRRQRADQLRLGVRVALPPARPRRERHDAARSCSVSRRRRRRAGRDAGLHRGRWRGPTTPPNPAATH